MLCLCSVLCSQFNLHILQNGLQRLNCVIQTCPADLRQLFEEFLYIVLSCLANAMLKVAGDVLSSFAAVECSHSAELNPAAAGHSGGRAFRGHLPRPSNSLISTAVQPTSPHQAEQQQAASPKLNRANSVVSHTAPGGRPQGRAGTPASVYGQAPGFLLPSKAHHHSLARQLGADQARDAPRVQLVLLDFPFKCLAC